jgi:hypothetical protein
MKGGGKEIRKDKRKKERKKERGKAKIMRKEKKMMDWKRE